MVDMSSPRSDTPGDGRFSRQGTSLLYIAGEKTRASAPWGYQNAHATGMSVLNLFMYEVRSVPQGDGIRNGGEMQPSQVPAYGGFPDIMGIPLR